MQNFLKKSQRDTETLFKTYLAAEVERRFSPIERIDPISEDEFAQRYVKPGIPVIIKNMTDQWPAMKKWNFDFFQSEYGDVDIKINLYDSSTPAKEIKLHQALDKIVKGNELTYLQEWWFGADYPDLEKDFTTPPYFASCAAKELFRYDSHLLFVGSQGSSTYAHQDTIHTNVWSAQISGEKRWILFGRKAHLPILPDGSADTETFFQDPASQITHCRLLPGEILFIPYQWWHRVDLIQDSISLHGLYTTQDLLPAYVKDMFAIPLATALNRDLLLEKNKMRFDINMMSCQVFAKLMGFNVNNVLGVN